MIGIISDIHGNYPALCAVMEELEKKGCRKIYCLGDIVGYYCMINESIQLLRDRSVICIKGNHDSYLLNETKCPRSHSANYCIEYQKKIINEKNLHWMRELKNFYTDKFFSLVHGGWHNNLDEYIEEFDFCDEIIGKYKGDIFLSGHTHRQTVQKKGQKIYCNPGSVGQPRDYVWTAAFAILENKEIKLYRTEYDIERIVYAMKKAGFEEYYYVNLYHGCKIGEIIKD